MPDSRIDFDLEGIAHVLEDNLLAVPIYQRSYSWQKDEIEDFWSDLRSSFSQADPEYFLGTIVLSKEGVSGRISIVDGQQRLATTAILLSAIRDEYKARHDETRANVVQTTFLAKTDLGTAQEQANLRLNSEDNEYFRKVVVEAQPVESVEQTHASHGYLAHALTTLRTKVHEAAEGVGSEWEDRLLGWTTFLQTRVQVIRVEVPTEAEAFLIFETLNDRGADLTIADLLKNLLFGKAGSHLDEVRDGWLLSLGALDMSAESALFTDFLRHYWSSRHGATRERELYKSIKSHIANESQAVEFVTELQKAARLYAALLNSDHDFWTAFGTGGRKDVETLLRLDLAQIRPLLLAAMQHFQGDELKRLLKAAVAWGVRGLIVGGIGGGTYERAYCDAAMKIRDGSVKTTKDVFAELEAIIPSDEEFRTQFGVARVMKASLARYYLVALERGHKGQAEPELVPNEDEEQVNLEHVLPRNAKVQDWPQFTKEQRRVFVNRVGNMTLLAKGPNGKIGNKSFNDKQPVLLASELELTKAAGNEADWTPDVIQTRQKKLAELAVKVWVREP